MRDSTQGDSPSGDFFMGGPHGTFPDGDYHGGFPNGESRSDWPPLTKGSALFRWGLLLIHQGYCDGPRA